MRPRDLSSWMWSEALSLIDRADRLHRQFFTHAADAWEPPIDVVESGDAVRVQVALPGVRPDAITIALDPEGVTVSALRAFSCREAGAHIHRLEIPYGRFERRIGLAAGELELADKVLADGVLTLVFHKKESA